MLNILLLLFWFTSAALSGLAYADLRLRDSQKKWISNRATDFWNWLDDQTEPKYLRYLRGFRWQRFVAILYALVALVVAVGFGILVHMGAFDDAEIQAKTPRNFQYFILAAYIASFLAALVMVRVLPSVLNWVTKTEGSWAYIGRSTIATVATIALYYAAEAVFSLSISNPAIDPSNPEEFFAKAFSFSHPITAVIFGASVMFAATVALVMLMSWALVVIPVILVLLLMLLFRIGEFVALRVAENPKTPQYALSFLLAAVSAAASGLRNSWS
jgi:hypothetical protein